MDRWIYGVPYTMLKGMAINVPSTQTLYREFAIQMMKRRK